MPEKLPEDTNPQLANSLKESGVDVGSKKRTRKKQPFYKAVGESRVPVSKAHGKVWKARKGQALAKRKANSIEQSWDEALNYFYNDQMRHRKEGNDPDTAGNTSVAEQRNRRFSETENIIFANTRSLVPALYAKNPQIEATTYEKGSDGAKEEARKFATMVERLVNVLFVKKAAPGINLKPKARRCVVLTTLTNKSWIEVGYTFKEQSSDAAFAEISDIAAKLAKAKTPQEIEKLEGQLMAAEKKIDVLTPAGPFAKFRSPYSVLVDPAAVEQDGSDANWMMCDDYLPTEFIAAVYAKENIKGEMASIYQPTHIISPSEDAASDVEAQVNTFSLLTDASDYKKHGFEDEESYEKAKCTRVWRVWDKVTRRVLLYNDKDWTWPIWVWDDPYHLDTFFPFFPMEFYTDPLGGDSKGEVTYIQDQQDAINEINDEERRARQALRRAPAYNKNVISSDDYDKLLRNDVDAGIGIDVPEGQTLKDNLLPVAPTSIDFPQVFNTERKMAAIDRISSTNDVIRGAQFKTNTTNRAIESYEATTNTVLDEKVDAIEDLIGCVGWAVAQLCLQFMPKQIVAELIGDEAAQAWPADGMQPQDIRSSVAIRTVGGSTAKPTSRAKKKEAIEVGQVIGQFASSAPVTLEIALRVMEQAFDEITISEEDWTKIRDSIAQTLQQGQSQPAGVPGAVNSSAPGQPTSGAAQGAAIPPELQTILGSLPPQVQQAIQTAVAQGVPAELALQQIMQQLGGGTQAGVQ